MSSVAYTSASTAPKIDTRGTMALSATVVSGANGKGSIGGPGRSPFRHIDDLVSVSVDIDPHTPLRKVLEIGDVHMRQATTFNDFRRPDLALQEYIMAFTIAVDKVPRHKDYPSMKSDRGDLNRLYHALKLKITTNGATFEKIKDDIKQDNQISGVQPTTSTNRSSSSDILERNNISSNTSQPTQLIVSKDTRKNYAEDEHNTSITNGAGAGPRQKPTVQPKPQALHGKAIKQTQKSPQEDLADRFARLRESKKLASTIPGECSPAQSLPTLDTSVSVAAMPKVPQAIYNPARGTVTSEVANLPSSSPRGMFSRAKLITPTPSVPSRMLMENAIATSSREQFVAANTYGASEPWKTSERARISADDTITATALANLLNQHSPSVDILIIDVRDRESFDEGHIKSHRTICVEPEILMRESISAEDIVDSMVLAPATETLAMEQRDKVDLVVIYDEDSTSIPSRVTGSSSEMILYNIRHALSYYSYSRPLKADPKLLRGGLDAWIHQFGEQSLETSDTVPSHARGSIKPTSGYGSRRRSRIKSRPLGSDEVKQFEAFIQQDGDEMFDYIRSKDNFVRREPNSAATPESMSHSLPQKLSQPGHALGPQEEDYLDTIGPAPPRRPAPAVPKTRFSGLESTDDDEPTFGAYAKMASGSGLNSEMTLTGLANGSNNCFANSAMQAFLASPRLAEEFLSPNFPQNWRQASGPEPTHPQLLCKIMANSLQWMNKRQFKVMKLALLMHYLRAVHTGYVSDDRLWVFGDGRQHDSEEFSGFLLSQLTLETDVTRRVAAWGALPIPATISDKARFLANAFWEWQTRDTSLPTQYFSIFSVSELTCKHCKRIRNTPGREQQLPIGNNPSRGDLMTLARRECNEEINDWRDSDDGGCGQVGATRKVIMLRYPPILRILLKRTEQLGHLPNGQREMRKHFRPCHFPENMDLSEFSYPQELRQEVSNVIPPPFNDGIAEKGEYELYAIVVHYGTSMNLGHYYTYVREKPDAPYKGADARNWLRCDDSTITPYRGAAWERELRNLRDIPEKKGPTPVQLFYRRRDVPYGAHGHVTGPGIPSM